MNTVGTRDTGKNNTGKNCSPGKQVYIQYTEIQNPICKTKSYTFFQNKYSQTHAKCSRKTLLFKNVSGSPKDDKNVKMSKDSEQSKTRPIRSESRDVPNYSKR